MKFKMPIETFMILLAYVLFFRYKMVIGYMDTIISVNLLWLGMCLCIIQDKLLEKKE